MSIRIYIALHISGHNWRHVKASSAEKSSFIESDTNSQHCTNYPYLNRCLTPSYERLSAMMNRLLPRSTPSLVDATLPVMRMGFLENLEVEGSGIGVRVDGYGRG